MEFVSTDIPKSILDNTTIASDIVVPYGGTITKVTVKVNITHTYDSDLTITLIAPDDTRVELSGGCGGNKDGFNDVVFDQSAETDIDSATTSPIVGTYRPYSGDLSVLNGKNPLGTWQLEVNDGYSGDQGTLNSWSMNIDGVIVADVNTIDFTAGSHLFKIAEVTAGANLFGTARKAVTLGGFLVTDAVVPNRPGSYDGNKFWDEGTKSWIATRDAHSAGGGRYQERLIAIAEEGKIYFSE